MQSVGYGRVASVFGRRTSVGVLVALTLSLASCSDGGSACGLLESCSGVAITVTPATVTVAVDDTVHLSASVTGSSNQSVSWSVTSGGSVASVGADGVVTGLSVGAAVVQATANADSNARASVAVTVIPDPCVVFNPIALGQTVSGALGADSCVLDDRNTDLWTFTLAVTTDVIISLSSSDFDAYLILARVESGSLVAVAEDDDSGGGLNSQLAVQLPPATYLILASTFDPGETGSYSLSLIEN
jgi:hypothetical protein